MLASRRRHDTVILPTPPTGNSVCSSHEKPNLWTIQVWPERPTGHARVLAPDNCCIALGKLRHNSQLLGKGTALYGCRGMRPKSAIAGPRGYRVTNSHVIHNNFGHRYALAALGGADLRRPCDHCAGRGRINRQSYVSRLWV